MVTLAILRNALNTQLKDSKVLLIYLMRLIILLQLYKKFYGFHQDSGGNIMEDKSRVVYSNGTISEGPIMPEKLIDHWDKQNYSISDWWMQRQWRYN